MFVSAVYKLRPDMQQMVKLIALDKDTIVMDRNNNTDMSLNC